MVKFFLNLKEANSIYAYTNNELKLDFQLIFAIKTKFRNKLKSLNLFIPSREINPSRKSPEAIPHGSFGWRVYSRF